MLAGHAMSTVRTERLLNLLTLLLNTRRPLSFRAIRELDEFDAYKVPTKAREVLLHALKLYL